MKLSLIPLMITGCLWIGCGNKKTEQSKEGSNVPQSETPEKDGTAGKEVQSECFRYTGSRDTVYLRLIETYNILSGLLIYKDYRKLQTMGTVEGKMAGDLFLADYTFNSEGKVFTRQVAFKRMGSDLVEGFGETKEVNGKVMFTDINKLTYKEGKVLKNVPCKQ